MLLVVCHLNCDVIGYEDWECHWCILVRLLHTCQLSGIICGSRYGYGSKISWIKSSYELYCALIWNFSHFLPKFNLL